MAKKNKALVGAGFALGSAFWYLISKGEMSFTWKKRDSD